MRPRRNENEKAGERYVHDGHPQWIEDEIKDDNVRTSILENMQRVKIEGHDGGGDRNGFGYEAVGAIGRCLSPLKPKRKLKRGWWFAIFCKKTSL